MKLCKNCGTWPADTSIILVSEGTERFEVKICTECMEEAIMTDKTYAEWLEELEDI